MYLILTLEVTPMFSFSPPIPPVIPDTAFLPVILDSTVWSIGDFRSYTYDANGNLIEGINCYWDSETYEWNVIEEFSAYWSELSSPICDTWLLAAPDTSYF